MVRPILRWGAIVALVLFVAIQLKQPDRSNPPVEVDVAAPAEIDAILRQACYDCHSNETRWPWYSYVAPLSWWTAEHVEHGRSEMNFSHWPVDDPGQRDYLFKEIREQIEDDEMPLESYRIMHAGARLTDEEKQALLSWARP